ncbi:CATRA system-associated protein [Streptomyces sp. LUP30]|uniref:CATRA system-associated protein n=1 Tax=Streptomyces sp. LUP30 TaxID=1890285 RepID=UPI0008519C65|nr:CATRA system-associated protein [Streptomyces sp. LUP30]
MSGGAPIDGESRDDAVDVLKDLIEWELAPQRWEQVDSIVDSLADAVARGDGDALREATAELELTGPVRITRIGAKSVIPVPEETRDRANHLVHALGRQQERQQQERADASSDGPGGDGDGTSAG